MYKFFSGPKLKIFFCLVLPLKIYYSASECFSNRKLLISFTYLYNTSCGLKQKHYFASCCEEWVPFLLQFQMLFSNLFYYSSICLFMVGAKRNHKTHVVLNLLNTLLGYQTEQYFCYFIYWKKEKISQSGKLWKSFTFSYYFILLFSNSSCCELMFWARCVPPS